ncbi:N-acyl-D-amino-acid deacylase family protein [Sphingobium sp. SYK-6]|uniref:N-acyl-D-amino-acid deacylase family protein n=1 Tax=Sphingobium sp. (strain NBRC 103272 / SYK-6) TaxID=627192 RepID=UPI0009FD04E6|nr:amidohydrolase family protein [Sphingobium sp. SYK-6]
MKKASGLMRRTVRVAAMAALFAGTSAFAQDYDVLIRGGTVYDGTGSEGQKVDVAIRGERIVEVGRIAATATASTVVDATGKIVSPGFIDPHSHAGEGLVDPEVAGAAAILYQGITTLAINPDGGGPGDIAPQLATIEGHGTGINVVPLIGHNGVRRDVMGVANRKASSKELAAMEALVKKGMEDGAYGFSSGPFYVPGKYSDTAELVQLARVAAQYPHSFHISHIRDESNYDIGVLDAIGEVIEVSRQARIPGIVTHMKVLGPQLWGKSREAVALIESARAEGLSIWADQYPYAASGSGLQPALLPGWAQEGGPEAIARRLQDPKQRAVIREAMVENLARRGGANAIMIRNFPPDPSLQGQRLDEIAAARGMHPLDVAIDMLIQGGSSIVSFNMSEDDIEYIMRQPWTMTSTDGGLQAFGVGGTHPRSYGAFPRKIRNYVLDKPVIPMAQAIHSSTGLTAQVLHIDDRGVLRAGAYADVIVFDPKAIRDTATYDKPHAFSEGMSFILVNGKPALVDGKVTDERHGKVLRRAKD